MMVVWGRLRYQTFIRYHRSFAVTYHPLCPTHLTFAFAYGTFGGGPAVIYVTDVGSGTAGGSDDFMIS